MDSRRFKCTYLITFVLAFVVVLNFYSTPKDVVSRRFYTVEQKNLEIVTKREPEPVKVDSDPKDLPHYKIDGMDRFEWYTKKRNEQLIRNKQNGTLKPEITEISMLRAYEYDVEYAVSITTSDSDKAILYCRYFDNDGKEILPAFQSFDFPKHVVNCEKRKGTKRISISTQATNHYTYPIPFVDRTKIGNPKYELSFCMAPIFGTESKWLFISEIIEHYRMQGVTHFYFYVFNINEYDRAMLEDYIRTGEVEATYIMSRNKDPYHIWQWVANRDCTLRARHESKWTIFADLDERLLMTQYSGTILDYFRNVSDTNHGSFRFRQQWIMKTEFMPEKYEGDKQIDTWLPTLRWHNSSSFGGPGHTAKCVIRAERVFSMAVHYPELSYPGWLMYDLKPEEGIVRHYRDQTMQNWGTRWLKEVLEFGPMSMTDYPKKYQKNLTEAVKKRAKYVYENYKNS